MAGAQPRSAPAPAAVAGASRRVADSAGGRRSGPGNAVGARRSWRGAVGLGAHGSRLSSGSAAPLSSARVSEERLRPPRGGSSVPRSGSGWAAWPGCVLRARAGKWAHLGKGAGECRGSLSCPLLSFALLFAEGEVSQEVLGTLPKSHRSTCGRDCLGVGGRRSPSLEGASADRGVQVWIGMSQVSPVCRGRGFCRKGEAGAAGSMLSLLSYCFLSVETEVTLNH